MANNSVTHLSSSPSTSRLLQVSNVTVNNRVDSSRLNYQTTKSITNTRWVTVRTSCDLKPPNIFLLLSKDINKVF